MGKRRVIKESVYPVHPWKIIETEFDNETNFLDETIFALGNGYLGTRGTFEEGYDGPTGTSMEGTYLNGFYETVPIHYDETAYGYASHTETMLNLPNGKLILLQVEDELMSFATGTIEQYHRELDLQQGMLIRHMRWISPKGRIVNIETERIISLIDQHLMMIRYSVTPINFNGKITLVSMLDGHVHNQTSENDPRIGTSLKGQTLKLEQLEQEKDTSKLLQITTYSKLQVLSAVRHVIETECRFTRENYTHGQMLEHRYTFDVEQGQRVMMTKAVVYLRSDRKYEQDLWETADELLGTACHYGWAHYHMLQRQVLDDFWSHSDVEITGDDSMQQGIRFNMFHLFQAAGRDGRTNIGAKGITGEGYQGHYFWDSEIYIVPFFTYTHPWIARKLLKYRYHTLSKARQRAQVLFRKPGALFPWRTITGIECSSYYPAGTAQYHINADITYAIRQYVDATGDQEFLKSYGAEIVFETARIWMYVGDFIPARDNMFCINTVTGPDEYAVLVNNNFFTNSMAKMHLQYAVETAEMLRKEEPQDYERISSKILLHDSEIERWSKAAADMYLPKYKALDIHPQDDAFLSRTVWPFDETPEGHYPLLLNYHPLEIYRHQVCKQADVILALYLLSDQFTIEEKAKDLEYYEKVTVHDSSLSKSIFSIVSAEVGLMDDALMFFNDTARLDLDNHQGNTQHGIHTASMGGTWHVLIAGFAGMRTIREEVKFSPKIPKGWQRYAFRFKFRGNSFKVAVNEDTTVISLLEGSGLRVSHYDESKWLGVEETIEFSRKKENET